MKLKQGSGEGWFQRNEQKTKGHTNWWAKPDRKPWDQANVCNYADVCTHSLWRGPREDGCSGCLWKGELGNTGLARRGEAYISLNTYFICTLSCVSYYTKKTYKKETSQQLWIVKMLKEQHKILRGQKTSVAVLKSKQGKAHWPWPWPWRKCCPNRRYLYEFSFYLAAH